MCTRCIALKKLVARTFDRRDVHPVVVAKDLAGPLTVARLIDNNYLTGLNGSARLQPFRLLRASHQTKMTSGYDIARSGLPV